ncbi:hypothetical protein MKX01_032361 [Papaver californicum]|nr:hypothetical protein MKX01_032361 [Papaver californicum]
MGAQHSHPYGAQMDHDGSGIQEIHSKHEWRILLGKTCGSNQLMVVDFTALWCGPCKFFEPTILEFALKFRDVTFVKIDVDVLPEVANDFNVTAIPAFVMIKEGKEIDKVVGVNKEALEMKIQKHRSQEQQHPLLLQQL